MPTRNLRCLWTSQLLSQVADGVTKLALLWFVYSVTGSAFKTTLIGLLQTISSIVCTPFIGVLVDRLPKKGILVVTDLLRGVFLGFVPWLVPSDVLTVDLLYGLVFLYGLTSAVFTPALSASVPFLVSRRRFTAGNAVLQSTTSIGIILGPIMSGIGIAALGPKEVLSLNTVTYVASALLLLPMQFQDRASVPAARKPRTIAALLEAARFVFRSSPTIVRLIIIAALYTFATAALTTLLPVFGKSLFQFGPVEVGYFWSSLGVGFLVVSIGLLRVSTWTLRARVYLVAGSSAVAGVALLTLLSTMNLAVALALMAIVGAGIGTLTPVAWGILQELSPLPMLGRVMGLYTAVAMTTSLAGIWGFGWLVQEWGPAIGLMGIATILLSVAGTSVLFAGAMTGVTQVIFMERVRSGLADDREPAALALVSRSRTR